MFETLKNVFRVKEMRRKLLYLIWMIFVIRIGCQIPVPGVDSDFFKQWFSTSTLIAIISFVFLFLNPLLGRRLYKGI